MERQDNKAGFPKRDYVSPSGRVIPVKTEYAILGTQTEPIIDDGQIHTWD